MKPKRLIALALVLLGGLLLFVILDNPPALPAVMILPPGPLAVKSGRVPDRWIPAKWTWLHRVCRFFLGAPKQIFFIVSFTETSEKVSSILVQDSLGQPQAESNGVALWILPEETFRPFTDKATGLSAIRPAGILLPDSILKFLHNVTKFSANLRVSSEDRMESTVRTSDSTTSHSAILFARLGKETIDLSTRLIVTANGQTNFVAAARAQLPYGHVLFVLDVRQPESATVRMAALITADEVDSAGNVVDRKTAGR